MALLLETTLGDLVIDLDVAGSPALARNLLDLAHARYFTQTLVYNVTPGRFCQLGDPRGDGSGGACWRGVLDAGTNGDNVTQSRKRFLKSHGRRLTPAECQEKGRVVATEMKGIPDTIGSQFLITLDNGPDRALDGYSIVPGDARPTGNREETTTSSDRSFLSLGRVTEDDQDVLGQLNKIYCDAEGRPFADVRVHRISVVHNPFENCAENDKSTERRDYLKGQGVEWDNDSDDKDTDIPWHITASPDYERPPEERVEPRIPIDQIDMTEYNEANGEDEEAQERALAQLTAQQHEEALTHDAKSRANVLEMLGDLPDAEIRAPENVLFVCKMNPVTEDEDLELIFSRFDPQVKAEIIRDHDTGASLQYAFVEFTTKQQASEAYFKMNNALVDDRRIKVDFSQSVATIWDKYNQKLRPGALPNQLQHTSGGGRGRGGRGRGRGPGPGGRGRGGRDGGGRGGNYNSNHHRGKGGPIDQHRRHDSGPSYNNNDRNHNGNNHPNHHRPQNDGMAVDEFGRARAIPAERNDRHSEDRHRNHPQHRDRRDMDEARRRTSRSRSRSASPGRRHRDRSRSRSRDRSRSRKDHRHRDHKKKRKHHDDRERRHRRHDSHKRRYDSEEEDQVMDHGAKARHQHQSKRRYDSDASDEERRHSKKQSKHHKHHKRRKRSRSRSRSRSR